MVRNLIGSFTPQRKISLTVVFDNMSADNGLTPDGGFSCLIRGYGGTILFDTGARGDILLSNMEKLGLDPLDVDLVVLSHEHDDHTGGLAAFLEINPQVEVVMPGSFPDKIKSVAEAANKVRLVKEAGRVIDGVSSTGEMGAERIEQSLVLKTPRGLVVLTGCAHPGVEEIAARAAKLFEGKPHLVAGGFHLGEASDEDLERIMNHLRELGVERVAPTHCSGEKAVEAFRTVWGDRFVEFHLGSTLEF